ncbi:MAG TPA: hypothetical protein VGM57_06130 [Pseudolabrys sp.]|jgi:hypothetical protein
MPFLAYIAIILVSLGGILFEVNWLTSPKLETKPAMQASRLTTSPKIVEATPAPRQVETQPSESVSEPAPDTAANAPPQQTAQQTAPVPPITPAPSFSAVETTGTGSTDFKREFNNDAKADSSISSATFTPAVTPPAVTTPAIAASSSNKCDIAACSASYQSFRASDCSYQPMDGTARKTCDRTQGSTQQASVPSRERNAVRADAARKPNKEAGKEAGLRSFEREVRRITASEANHDPGYNRERTDDRSQVIMIERPAW